MINRKQIKQAIAIFTFVTQLFPDSANAWDSLAEGFLKAGDKKKAAEYYNKTPLQWIPMAQQVKMRVRC